MPLTITGMATTAACCYKKWTQAALGREDEIVECFVPTNEDTLLFKREIVHRAIKELITLGSWWMDVRT